RLESPHSPPAPAKGPARGVRGPVSGLSVPRMRGEQSFGGRSRDGFWQARILATNSISRVSLPQRRTRNNEFPVPRAQRGHPDMDNCVRALLRISLLPSKFMASLVTEVPRSQSVPILGTARKAEPASFGRASQDHDNPEDCRE